MYEAYYGLSEKPFSILPDPDFLYWGQAHSMAFAMLKYGVANQAGFTVITGEIGSGKTTLIRHLLNNIDEDITVGLISNLDSNTTNLLSWIMMALDQPFEGLSEVQLFKQFQDFLIAKYAAGGRTVLIIDEAQNLGEVNLESLRMLSNINADKHQLLQLVLVGQPQLRDLLQSPALKQFAQRVSSDFHLRPIRLEETREYIAHRLEIAGGDPDLFTRDAIQMIFEASGGIPRSINILCDTALVYGFAIESPRITQAIVKNVIDDKQLYGVFPVNGTRDWPVPLKQVGSDD